MKMHLQMIRNNFLMVQRAVDVGAQAAVKSAAEDLEKTIKDKIGTGGGPSSPGNPPRRFTGRLHRGVAIAEEEGGGLRGSRTYVVGFTAPASHAHLLEFGTPHMAPRPFFRRSYEESVGSLQTRVYMRFKAEFAMNTIPSAGGSF